MNGGVRCFLSAGSGFAGWTLEELCPGDAKTRRDAELTFTTRPRYAKTGKFWRADRILQHAQRSIPWPIKYLAVPFFLGGADTHHGGPYGKRNNREREFWENNGGRYIPDDADRNPERCRSQRGRTRGGYVEKNRENAAAGATGHRVDLGCLVEPKWNMLRVEAPSMHARAWDVRKRKERRSVEQ
jgi:hypothetical protein